MLKPALVAALALGLGGCVAVWGKAYHVEEETSDSVTIKYDDNFGSIDEVRQVAETSCQAHGKDAVPARDPSASLWGISTAEFDCVMPR